MKRIFLIAMLLLSVVWINQNTFAQEKVSKVYWMATIEVPLANLAEFHAFNSEKLGPLMQEHGYSEVATWQTIVGEVEEGSSHGE